MGGGACAVGPHRTLARLSVIAMQRSQTRHSFIGSIFSGRMKQSFAALGILTEPASTYTAENDMESRTAMHEFGLCLWVLQQFERAICTNAECRNGCATPQRRACGGLPCWQVPRRSRAVF